MGLLAVCMFTVAFAMVAKRLAMSMITAPMAFLAFGVLLSFTGWISDDAAEEILHIVAEITLIILLFLDAAQIDLAALRKQHVWPVRLLVFGMPLMLLLGIAAAAPFLPAMPLVAIALVAAILMPTDAALGQSVITNPLVPERVRRAITVESGLNDGLALPAVLLFASLAAGGMSADPVNWFTFTAKQLVLGPVVGGFIGLAGGAVLLFAKRRNLTSDIYEGVGAIALAAGAYLAADLIDGNGFIAAFAAGLAFGNIIQGKCKFVFEFTESEGQLLSWSAFLLIGLALVPNALSYLDPATLALILVSLIIVRPIVVWISLMGTDASPLTRIFIGWFGPRGLATALFALVALTEVSHELAEPILAIAVNAVWISALLHGVTAAPAARWYAKLIQRRGPCPETQKIETSAKPLKTHSG